MVERVLLELANIKRLADHFAQREGGHGIADLTRRHIIGGVFHPALLRGIEAEIIHPEVEY